MHTSGVRLGRWRPLWLLLASVGALLVVGAGGGAFWVQQTGQAAGTGAASAARPAPPQGVGALGRLEPGWKVHSVAPASGAEGSRVERLLVEEGDQVEAGAVLAILDTHARRAAALAEAEGRAAVARARLDLVRAGPEPGDIAAQEAVIANHRAALAHAAWRMRRAEPLIQRDVVTVEEYEQRTQEHRTAETLLRQAESTLTALTTVRPEDVAVAAAELQQAEAGVARARAELDAATLCAPLTGRVLKIHARPGERIGESGLLEIGDTAEMHAVAEVYERDVLRVQMGQRARVRVQSLPEDLEGEVIHVGWRVGRRVVLDNDPLKDTDARVVEVRIRLDAAASRRVERLSYARVEVHLAAPPAAEGP